MNFSGVSICRARIVWKRSSGRTFEPRANDGRALHRLAFDRPARRELKKRREVGKFPGWQLDVNRLRVTERVGLGLPVMRGDREAVAFGDGRQCVIGGNAGDPSVVPLRHCRTKANTSRNIEQQPLELPFGLAGCVVFRLSGGNVRRQHGRETARRHRPSRLPPNFATGPTSSQRNSTFLPKAALVALAEPTKVRASRARSTTKIFACRSVRTV